MSQVIVTNDNLQQKRESTRAQEAKIDREVQFNQWRRNDITGRDPIASAIGFAMLPIVGLWMGISMAITLMFTALKYLFKGMGRLIGGSRNLITGTR